MPAKYQGVDRRNNANGQFFRIPALVLIVAFVASLLALATWSVRATTDLDHRKADKVDVQAIKDDVKEIRTDVKELIRRR